MKQSIRWAAVLLALPLFTGACSGLGTSFSKMGRLRQNKGYEVAADLPIVLKAAVGVLQAHGYQVSQKADPSNGAESAGLIVIGERLIKYDAAPDPARAGAALPLQTRDLVDVYLSKKWQFSSSDAAPNITLVEIVGGSYLRKSPAGTEEERPLTPAFVAELRGEIEHAVDEGRSLKPAGH